MKHILFIVFLFSLFSGIAFGIEKTYSASIYDSNVAWKDCVYLNKGEFNLERNLKPPSDGWIGRSYRVAFILSEIYYSITVEEIEHNDTLPDQEFIKNTYFIEGDTLWRETLGMKDKGEAIVRLNFVKWENWNTFILEIHEKNVRFHISERSNKSGEIKFKIDIM